MEANNDRRDGLENIDELLDKEKENNKKDGWNKIDKTEKIQKLHIFAEEYGKSNNFSDEDIVFLKSFFMESLNKNRLQKTKDVVYDKKTKSILSIPSLFFNSGTKRFSLKMMDNKRVSTMKSLTPKRPIIIEP